MGTSVCCGVLLNINFKHLNRDTSRVPPRRAQLATLDRACHRSARIKEEEEDEETHQLFNKRVASLGLPSVTLPISPRWLPAQRSPRKPKKEKTTRHKLFIFLHSFFSLLQLLSHYCFYFRKTRPILMRNSFDLISSVNKLVCHGRGKRCCGGIRLLCC